MTDEQEKALRTASALLCGMGYLEQADTINGMLAAGAPSVADARPLNDEQIAKAWFGDEYGPGHTRAPGYVYTFLKALNESPAPSVADTAGAITWCEGGKHEN